MSKSGFPVVYMGRIFGLVVLLVVQVFIGLIHVFFGADLIATGFALIYSVYTLLYGLLTAVFAYGLWLTSRWGWIGTLGVSGFVIVMDSATLLNTPIISDIPSFAAVTEIVYSLVVILYLLQPRIQSEFLTQKNSSPS